SGTTITNITGNGYNVYYDTSSSDNNYLGGLTYSLVNGGYLIPSTSNSIGVKEQIAGAFLLQNYPNPFNPTTTIKYSVPMAGFISIKVYDVTGRQVATLVDEEKIAGQYQTEFDGTNLTSGIYYYKIQAGDFQTVKKCVLMK
ncbi:MAG: T9SS type A sorting domain-containing protein, partial [Candidatus Marinimicrobia bacterium]|nr:T9SS type A sorting domain-containing protein [Candidatus Neomarinimicrobiota bacterium]